MGFFSRRVKCSLLNCCCGSLLRSCSLRRSEDIFLPRRIRWCRAPWNEEIFKCLRVRSAKLMQSGRHAEHCACIKWTNVTRLIGNGSPNGFCYVCNDYCFSTFRPQAPEWVCQKLGYDWQVAANRSSFRIRKEPYTDKSHFIIMRWKLLQDLYFRLHFFQGVCGA